MIHDTFLIAVAVGIIMACGGIVISGVLKDFDFDYDERDIDD